MRCMRNLQYTFKYNNMLVGKNNNGYCKSTPILVELLFWAYEHQMFYYFIPFFWNDIINIFQSLMQTTVGFRFIYYFFFKYNFRISAFRNVIDNIVILRVYCQASANIWECEDKNWRKLPVFTEGSRKKVIL